MAPDIVGDYYFRIRNEGVVALVVEEENDWDLAVVFTNRFAVNIESSGVALDFVRDDDKPVEVRARAVCAEADAVLAADCKAGEGCALFDKFDEECFRWWRLDTVHFVRENVEYLAATRPPVVLGLYGVPIREDERVRERVRRHRGFIVVDFARRARDMEWVMGHVILFGKSIAKRTPFGFVNRVVGEVAPYPSPATNVLSSVMVPGAAPVSR